MSKWISVDAKLPLNEADLGSNKYRVIGVLSVSDGLVYMDEYSIGGMPRFWGSFGRGSGVTHWQPLPEPPK